MTRDRKPRGFFYLDHVTPENTHDATPFLERIDSIKSRFNLPMRYAGTDASYFNTRIFMALIKRSVQGVIGPPKYSTTDNKNQNIGFNT